MPDCLPRLYHALLDVLAPRTCAACAATPDIGQVFCPSCSALLAPAAAHTELASGVTLIAPFAYAPPLSQAIHAFKYSGRADLAAPLSRLVLPHLAARARTWDALVPVPLHPLRLAERGYNQAALLARACVAGSALRVLPRGLARVRHAPRQVGHGRRERLDNAFQAFCASEPKQLRSKKVALVDDVVTTGATARACIEALRTVGADVCAVVCIARAEAPSK
jgi:ComF family protein